MGKGLRYLDLRQDFETCRDWLELPGFSRSGQDISTEVLLLGKFPEN